MDLHEVELGSLNRVADPPLLNGLASGARPDPRCEVIGQCNHHHIKMLNSRTNSKLFSFMVKEQLDCNRIGCTGEVIVQRFNTECWLSLDIETSDRNVKLQRLRLASNDGCVGAI